MQLTRTGLVVACALSASCTSLKAHLMADAVTDGLLAIDGYRGRVTERGLLRDAPDAVVVKDVLYRRGWKVRAEVREPAEQAGELFVCDGATITLWWPRFFFGLRIRGLEPPAEDAVEDAVLEGCRWTLAHYDPRRQGRAQVAGRDVDCWHCAPLTARPWCDAYRAWLDVEHQVPLKLTAYDRRGRPWYSMAFDAIDLAAPAPTDEAFRFELPEGALVHDWDLAAPGVTLAQAQASVDFPLLVPARLPEGHAVRKVVLSTTRDPTMVALLMDRGARWLSLSQMPNMGPILVPPIGLPVPIGEEEGVLNFAFGFVTLSWSVGTTFLTLIGNLPHAELLEVAASLRPLEPR